MQRHRDYAPFLDKIEEVLKENPELTVNIQIARKLIEKGVEGSENHLRLCVASYFEDYPKEVIEIEAVKEQPYEVVKNAYVFKTKHGVINIPVERIDDLFFDYSKHGKDMSQVAIINKYRFEVWQWEAVKRRLWLFKHSNIYSPHTVENTPKDQLGLMIEEKLKTLTDNMGELIERKYYNHQLSEAKKVIENSEKLSLFEKLFLTTDRDENQIPPVLKRTVQHHDIGCGHIVVTIADLHIGAKTVGSKLISNYDQEQARQWLLKAAADINSKRAEKVTVLLMGDYIESFTGNNHANSFQGMEYGVFGKRAYFNAVDIIAEFLGSVANVDSVMGVPGNHDRGDSRRDIDPKGEIGLMILEQLRRDFQSVFNVEYDDLILYKEIDGIGYGITHGHHSISKKKGEDLTFDYGNNRVYNVWLQAHLHEYKILQNTAKVVKAVSPSIFPGNYYSESLGYSSNPGYLVFENNGNGKANILYNPL